MWMSTANASPNVMVVDSNDRQAVSYVYSIPLAIQANTTNLWTTGVNGGDQHLGVMPGTSPATVVLANGHVVTAFQGANGNLFTSGYGGWRDWGVGMMADTSPSITATTNDKYQIAFQANTGRLWTLGDGGIGDHQLGMMPGTSPSIATLHNGATIIAFQAASGNLFTAGFGGWRDWGVGMMLGTSPSIAALSDAYVIAVQANSGNLWLLNNGVSQMDGLGGDTQLGMMPGTSPSIAGLPNGHVITAFQANNGNLYTAGYGGLKNWNVGMRAGTSPSVSAIIFWGDRTGFAGHPLDYYQIAFQANTGNLWTVGYGGAGDLQLGMAAHTSPSFTRFITWGVKQSAGTSVGPFTVWTWSW
jgi:hypothetical protein